jgi:hypothetical protein
MGMAAHPMAAAVLGEIGQASDVVEMRVGQEHLLDPELLGEAEHGRDRASLEQDRAVEQETGQVSPGGRPSLAAEDREVHGEHRSRKERQGALESGLLAVKGP